MNSEEMAVIAVLLTPEGEEGFGVTKTCLSCFFYSLTKYDISPVLTKTPMIAFSVYSSKKPARGEHMCLIGTDNNLIRFLKWFSFS